MMEKDIGVISYREPKWSREEGNRLAEEWLESDSELDICEYVLSHASERYKKEYQKAMSILNTAS